MSRGPLRFKQSDVTRAVKGAIAAGLDVVRIEIDHAGRIVILTAGAGAEEQPAPDDLDRELDEFRRRRP
jgi:hypothetical protein